MKTLKFALCLFVLSGSLTLTGCGATDEPAGDGATTGAADDTGSGTAENGTEEDAGGDGSTSK